MKILISIIIPTYKRKNSLLRLLESLKDEIKSKHEIIIVEQVVNNKEIFEKFAKKNKFKIQYIFISYPSTSHAKNIGAFSAKGKYIIFFDDDVIVEKDILHVYEKDFENDMEEEIGGIAGRVITPGQNNSYQSNNVGRISFLGTFSDNFSSLIPQEVDTVIGCNAAWRKDIFEKVNGFDEQFTGNAMREETDLSLRIKAVEYKIIFEPKAIATHLREATGGNRKTEGRMYWYYHFFSNETYFFLKHRQIFVTAIILLRHWEWALRCMFGFGREVSVRSFITPFSGIKNGIVKYKKMKELNKE